MKFNIQNPFKPSPPKSLDELKHIQEQQKELLKDDLDYADDCQAALTDEKLPWANSILYLFLGFIFIFLVWAYFDEIDTRTQGTGQVIPSKNIQLIQSLEGGIIAEILVKEGDIVKKNDVLVKMDDTIFKASYKENLARYDALQVRLARLTAESENQTTIDFPPELIKSNPKLVKDETALFQSRVDDFHTTVAHLKENLDLAQQELHIKEPLVKEGVISQVELLTVKRTVVTLQGQLEDVQSKYYKDTLEELTKTKAELGVLEESIRGYKDRLNRTVIRSPVYGTVKNILVNTIGGVVRPGENIMEIVPLDDTLLIKTRISPKDIGFIHPGQKAVVKFTAYDFSIYGGLDGVVENISADTIYDEKLRETFYEVKIRTHKNYLGPEWNPLPIIPGMIAEVSIITGKKTLLQYLLKPILRAKENAMSER